MGTGGEIPPAFIMQKIKCEVLSDFVSPVYGNLTMGDKVYFYPAQAFALREYGVIKFYVEESPQETPPQTDDKVSNLHPCDASNMPTSPAPNEEEKKPDKSDFPLADALLSASHPAQVSPPQTVKKSKSGATKRRAAKAAK